MQKEPSSPQRSRHALGAWALVFVLLLLLGFAVYILVAGWSSAGDATTDISTTGYVAMAFGVVATLALGIGLMALMFYSNRNR